MFAYRPRVVAGRPPYSRGRLIGFAVTGVAADCVAYAPRPVAWTRVIVRRRAASARGLGAGLRLLCWMRVIRTRAGWRAVVSSRWAAASLRSWWGWWPPGFGVSEDGGKGRPGKVSEDAVGVVGDGGPYVVSEDLACLLVRLTGGEAVEDGCEGVAGGGLEVVEGLAGGFGLVGMVVRFVPAGGDDRGPDEGGEQGGQRAAAGAGGGVGDVADGFAQGVGGLVLGADLGALGAGERS